MVHALRESHRVLKPEGILIDLRPAAVHRRVGLANDGRYSLRWVMRETFEDDHAADRAVEQVLDEGLFRTQSRTRIPCYRVMDTLDEFREWLDDFVGRGKCPPHDWLFQRVARAVGDAGIVISAPLAMRVMEKLD